MRAALWRALAWRDAPLIWTGIAFGAHIDPDIVAEMVMPIRRRAGINTPDDPHELSGRPLSGAERAEWEALQERLH